MKEVIYKSWGIFTDCYPPCGAFAEHATCQGEDENPYYRRVCICICHDGARSTEDQRAIMLMRAEAQDKENRERTEDEANARRVAQDRARTCQRCGQYYRWVGTSTGYHCGCGSNTKPWFNPWNRNR